MVSTFKLQLCLFWIPTKLPMNSISGMTVPKFQPHQSGLKWLHMLQKLDYLMLCMKSLNTITLSWLVPFSPLSYASAASAPTAEELLS